MRWISATPPSRNDSSFVGAGFLVHQSLRIERPTQILKRLPKAIAKCITWITLVKTSGTRLHIASVYLPAEGSSEAALWEQVLNGIKDAIAVFNELREDWIVLGDFNARVGEAETYVITENGLDLNSEDEQYEDATGMLVGRKLQRESADTR